MDDTNSRLPLLVDNVDTIKERKIKSIDARDFALSSSSINNKTVKSISFVVCNFALWAQCVQVIWTSMQIETRWLEKGLKHEQFEDTISFQLEDLFLTIASRRR